jgi:hypothetical protein
LLRVSFHTIVETNYNHNRNHNAYNNNNDGHDILILDPSFFRLFCRNDLEVREMGGSTGDEEEGAFVGNGERFDIRLPTSVGGTGRGTQQLGVRLDLRLRGFELD